MPPPLLLLPPSPPPKELAGLACADDSDSGGEAFVTPSRSGGLRILGGGPLRRGTDAPVADVGAGDSDRCSWPHGRCDGSERRLRRGVLPRQIRGLLFPRRLRLKSAFAARSEALWVPVG